MPIGTLYMCQECIYADNQKFTGFSQLKNLKHCKIVLHILSKFFTLLKKYTFQIVVLTKRILSILYHVRRKNFSY